MTSPLTVVGAITTTISTITSNITLDANYHTVLCNTTSAIIGVWLPVNSASIKGRTYKIKNASTSGNQVVVDGNGSLIDGASTYNIQYLFGVMGYNTLQSDGTNWWIV